MILTLTLQLGQMNTVPLFSDGVVNEYENEHLQDFNAVINYFSTVKMKMFEIFKGNQKQMKMAKNYISDCDGIPLLTELPRNYRVVWDSVFNSYVISGHPSGISFKSVADFILHFRWLCSIDRDYPCECVLCPFLKNTSYYGIVPSPSSNQPEYFNNYIQQSGNSPLKNSFPSIVVSNHNQSVSNYPMVSSPIDTSNTSPITADITSTINALKSDIQRLKNVKIPRLKFEISLLRKLMYDRIQSSLIEKTSYKRNRDDTSKHSELESDVELINDESGKKKRKKKIIDPHAPKRYANAFLLFSDLSKCWLKEEKRILEKLRAADSEDLIAVNNTTKALSIRWKALDERFRIAFLEMFTEHVNQYDLDIKKYQQLTQHNMEDNIPIIINPEIPKQAANGFFLYADMEEEKLQKSQILSNQVDLELYLKHISKSIIERWLLLSPEAQQGTI